jgi:hypothetical protein
MIRQILYPAFSLTVLISFLSIDTAVCNLLYVSAVRKDQDTLDLKQYLYNGRVWRDVYSHRVKGDQYLYSKEFLPGSVKFNGRSFKNLNLRYDILNDEIMIITDQGNILQLNKEMVDNFDLEYENITHSFTNSDSDSLKMLKGYTEILYKGNTALFVKYLKEITRSSQAGTNEVFEQVHRVYLLKDGTVYKISTKKEFLTLLDDKKNQITSYIRTNKLKVSRKTPGSFVPVLKFYDSISR